MPEIPAPPPDLAAYVGVRDVEDPVTAYLEQGRLFAERLLSLFPQDLDLRDQRVLDFGCGSGRFLRHMIAAGTGARFEGCDIHDPSIEWLARHLPTPHAVFVSPSEPPLPRPDGYFTLIYAMSVFTHLVDNWAAWLCELHRLLADGGLLIATVIGAGAGALFDEDPWQDDQVGMLVLGPGNPWAAEGPMVLHSEWWLRAHWGRAFEVLTFDDGESSGFGQGVVVMRRRALAATPEDLIRIEPGEPRELTALEHGLRRVHEECIVLNTRHDEYSNAYQEEARRRQELQRENDELRRQLLETADELAQARRARNATRTVLRALHARAHLLARRAAAARLRKYG